MGYNIHLLRENKNKVPKTLTNKTRPQSYLLNGRLWPSLMNIPHKQQSILYRHKQMNSLQAKVINNIYKIQLKVTNAFSFSLTIDHSTCK